MITRNEANQYIKAVAGGASPREGDVLKFINKGWRFERDHWLGVLSSDPSNAQDGDFWYNSTDSKLRVLVGGSIYESGAFTLKP